MDALVAKEAASEARVKEGKGLLLRVVQMLSKMIDSGDRSQRLRERSVSYGLDGKAEDDYEDEDDHEKDTG